MRGRAILIGFQDQTNLGLGYLASNLAKHGFESEIVDFREGPSAILDTVRSSDPLLVGFSLIFQYYLPQFAHLASYLRNNGVRCHFCSGGHYPSLRYEQMLKAVPELDSVVRCEGEATLVELMSRLAEGRDWHQIDGIAYLDGQTCIATPPAKLIQDLDDLPYPVRPRENPAILGKKICMLLASRGCVHDCAFCSIRQFYGQARGRKVRVRSAEKVAEEMRFLRDERGASVFLFQDDDFPLWGAFGRRWLDHFIKALRANDLIGRIIWKISCRADEVEPELFGRMREAGLYMVYLGLESGNRQGLQTLRKGLTVEDNLRAVEVLKQLGLFWCYGFMLFDPSSTFESVRENGAFLRKLTDDGSAAVTFCRMVPYAGTPIECNLALEGRLRGNPIDPDYDFIEPRMGEFFAALIAASEGWTHGPDALISQITWAWQEYWILRRLFPPMPGLEAYDRFLRRLTHDANDRLLGLIEGGLRAFEDGQRDIPISNGMSTTAGALAETLMLERNAFILTNQEAMIASLESVA